MKSLTKPLKIKCFLRFNFAITTICVSIRLAQIESTVLTDLTNMFVQKIRSKNSAGEKSNNKTSNPKKN